jgi:hypothetical protein
MLPLGVVPDKVKVVGSQGLRENETGNVMIRYTDPMTQIDYEGTISKDMIKGIIT